MYRYLGCHYYGWFLSRSCWKSLFTAISYNYQGAGSGIGLHTAKLFLAAGAKGVTFVDLNGKALQKIQTELDHEYAGRTLMITGDVTTEELTKSYVDETIAKWGHLDVRNRCCCYYYCTACSCSNLTSYTRYPFKMPELGEMIGMSVVVHLLNSPSTIEVDRPPMWWTS